MKSIKEALVDWLNQLNNFSFKEYEQMPDIDLYMEQVIGYLDKQLYIFKTTSDDKQVTPSMINNYVKGEVLPSPISKKYNREHLAIIEEICTLKQVLSIADVKQIIDDRYSSDILKSDIFNDFNDRNNKKIETAVSDSFQMLNNIDNNDTSKLVDVALDFALTANAYINIAKRILFLTRQYEYIKKTQEAKDEVDKKKKDKKEKENE